MKNQYDAFLRKGVPEMKRDYKLAVYHGGWWPDISAIDDEELRDKVDRHRMEHHAPNQVTDTCKHCKQPVDEAEHAYSTGYWHPYWRTIHKQCLDAQKREEAYQCQLIDADCNDCRHFSATKNLGNGIREGICAKLEKPARAYVNYASNHACFEHRKGSA